MDSWRVPDPCDLVDPDFLFGELTQLVRRVAKGSVQHAAAGVLTCLVAAVGQPHHVLRQSQDLDDALVAGPRHVRLQSEQFHRHLCMERTDQSANAVEASNALRTSKIAGLAPWGDCLGTAIRFVTYYKSNEVDPQG